MSAGQQMAPRSGDLLLPLVVGTVVGERSHGARGRPRLSQAGRQVSRPHASRDEAEGRRTDVLRPLPSQTDSGQTTPAFLQPQRYRHRSQADVRTVGGRGRGVLISSVFDC